jgi:type I restriction enzyme S subunit
MDKCDLNRVCTTRRLISRVGLEKINAKLFPPKTILLSTTATIGKVGIAEKSLSANQQITGIICGDDIHYLFLGYYLLRLGESGLKKLGGTATATHINQKNLRELVIPLPPLKQQLFIAEYLESLRQKIKALKKAQFNSGIEFNRMEKAILEKAFRGEL